MTVNWLKTWRRASFRGVQFWVDYDQITTGRRLVVHEFPHRDLPYIEDLGRLANRIDITAYLASDSLLSETSALFDACQKGGAAILQLPAERMQAHCELCERAWEKDRQGFIAFRLSFFREGAGPGPYPAPYYGRMANVAANAITAPLTDAVSAAVQVVGQPAIVLEGMIEEIRGVAVAIDTVRSSVSLDGEQAPFIARAVQDLYDQAEELADIGMIGDVWTPTAFQQTARGTSGATVVQRVAVIISELRAAARDPADVARALATLVSFGDGVATDGGTVTVRQMRRNAAAIAMLLRVAAIAQWVVALTEIEYRDRRSAIQARADIAEAIDNETMRPGMEHAYGLFVSLSNLRGHAIAYMSAMITDLAPVLSVSTGQSMPSLWLSNLLYGDASRAEELVDRNGVIHASFMPVSIEALGR